MVYLLGVRHETLEEEHKHNSCARGTLRYICSSLNETSCLDSGARPSMATLATDLTQRAWNISGVGSDCGF